MSQTDNITGEDVKTEFKEQAGLVQGVEPALPEGAAFDPEDIAVTAPTLETAPDTLGTKTAADLPTAVVSETASELDVTAPTVDPVQVEASKYTAYTAPNTPTGVAAQGAVSERALIGNVEGTVSEQAVAQAATGELDERATVQYQIGQLFQSFEEGSEPPAWASPAMRSVSAQMAARGLGASSMAAAAVTQAIMEAGIPIAKADADKYQQMQLTNLTNQQQAALQNAMTYAAMDKANLDARNQAAVNNARAFLNLDLQNLSNRQKISEVQYQGELQKLLTDTAAENASRQFNAESHAQIDQFYDQLDASIQAANKNRVTTQEQFNASSKNAMAQYLANYNLQREQFDINMSAQIEQSNVQWRRSTTTANTQADNEAERINAQNLYNLSTAAQARLWQEYRDNAAWILQFGEAEKDRKHQSALLALEQSGNLEMYEEQVKYDAIGDLADGVITKILFED